jgi:hypothetical protein
LKTLDLETWINNKVATLEERLYERMLQQKVKVLHELESQSTELEAGSQVMDEAHR